MTTIRATCPSCGDVRLKASDVVVRVCANDNKGSYCFRCPSCGLRVTKSADSRIVDLLASSGVKMDVWHLPAELWEARPTGAPVSYDDLLDFHLMLQDDTWFEQLADRISDVEK
jgi:hypothetical protein